jgi:hypothetical protein
MFAYLHSYAENSKQAKRKIQTMDILDLETVEWNRCFELHVVDNKTVFLDTDFKDKNNNYFSIDIAFNGKEIILSSKVDYKFVYIDSSIYRRFATTICKSPKSNELSLTKISNIKAIMLDAMNMLQCMIIIDGMKE